MHQQPSPRPQWAQRLRSARRNLGWDVTRLASELRRKGGRDVTATAQSLARMIRDWERGAYHPSERYTLLLTQVLGVDFDEDDAPRPIARPVHGGKAQAATTIRATSASIIALDVRFGSRELVGTAVRAAAHAARAAHAQYSDSRDVLAAASEAQQIAGWIAFDAERQDLSRRMTLESLLTARTAGDRSMELCALGQLVMQDIHMHRPAEAMQICRTALDEGVSGAVRTMFTLRAARAAAQMGEHTRALDLIRETRSLLHGRGGQDPPWTWWVTESEISWHHAMICTDTGAWGEAVEHFAASCRRPADQAWATRISQASLLWALAHAQAWDEAEKVLTRDVLPNLDGVASARTDRTLASAARLLGGAPGRPTLREASHQIAASA